MQQTTDTDSPATTKIVRESENNNDDIPATINTLGNKMDKCPKNAGRDSVTKVYIDVSALMTVYVCER